MPFFTKKPVTIEAVLWDGGNHREMWDFLTGEVDSHMNCHSKNHKIDHSMIEGGLIIKTEEGLLVATIGDWVIKGVKGEFYPCKPDIFELTYNRDTEVERLNPKPRYPID